MKRRSISWLVLAGAMAWLASTPARSQVAGHKAPLSGLISMGNMKFHRHDAVAPDNSLDDVAAKQGAFGGVVMNITWRQVEPVEGHFVTEAIDQALAGIRAYNRSHPAAPLGADLRIFAGQNAPDWVKGLGGSPVMIHRTVPGQPIGDLLIGRFWTPAYRRAYADMQHALAKRYDEEPLIREVSNTACASVTDEPFVYPYDSDSISHLHQAGFSDASLRDCLTASLSDFSGWRTTNIHFTFNPLHATDSGTRSKPDTTSTIQIMRAFRQAFGSRAILSNHSLMTAKQRPWLVPLMTAIKTFGPPIEFQTEAPKHQGFVWADVMADAISFGASAVEIWQGDWVGGFETVPETDLKQWAERLRQNRQAP